MTSTGELEIKKTRAEKIRSKKKQRAFTKRYLRNAETCLIITSYLVTNIDEILLDVGLFSRKEASSQFVVELLMRNEKSMAETWTTYHDMFPSKLDYDYMIRYLTQLQFIEFAKKENKYSLGPRVYRDLYLFPHELIALDEFIEQNKHLCFKTSNALTPHNEFFKKIYKTFPSRLTEKALLLVVARYARRVGVSILDMLHATEMDKKSAKKAKAALRIPKHIKDRDSLPSANALDSLSSQSSKKTDNDEGNPFIKDVLALSYIQHVCYCAIDIFLVLDPEELNCCMTSTRTKQMHNWLWRKLSEAHGGVYRYSHSTVKDSIDFAHSYSITNGRFPRFVPEFVYSFTQLYVQSLTNTNEEVDDMDEEIDDEKEPKQPISIPPPEAPSLEALLSTTFYRSKIVIPDHSLTMFPSTLQRIFPSLN